MPPRLKIGTWNVNGIRKRLPQVEEWMERERPDVVCLQEIKASPDQIPMVLCEMQGYWCYWHGSSGYSGVGLHVSRDLAPERPLFEHPPFDYENRIVTVRLPGVVVASVYVPERREGFSGEDAVPGRARAIRRRRTEAIRCRSSSAGI